MLFLHYWGVGRTEDLARALKHALGQTHSWAAGAARLHAKATVPSERLSSPAIEQCVFCYWRSLVWQKLRSSIRNTKALPIPYG